MIEMTFRPDLGARSFTWRCLACGVDDGSLAAREGIDSIVHHLRLFHGQAPLEIFAGLLKKGVDALPDELPKTLA